MCQFSQGGAPNYYPNSFGGPAGDPFAASWTPPPAQFDGKEDYYPQFYDEDNYSQPKVFWDKVLDTAAKERLVSHIFSIVKNGNGICDQVNNLAGSIKRAKKDIQERTVEVFNNVSTDLGTRLKTKLFGEAKVFHL